MGKVNALEFIKILLTPVDFIVLSASTKSSLKILLFLTVFRYTKEVRYFVIGGTLPRRLEASWINRRLIRHPSHIYVESEYLYKECRKVVRRKFLIVPNFKTINFKVPSKIKRSESATRLVFFSRVSVSKGILDTIESITELSSSYESPIYLDIYGPLEIDRSTFYESLKKSDKIQYCGVLDLFSEASSKNYDILHNYDALILPTKHYGEGFPGVFIDAMSVGLPIITTKFASNQSILSEKFTVWIENNTLDSIQNAIRTFIRRKEQEEQAMREASLQNYPKFSTDCVLSEIQL